MGKRITIKDLAEIAGVDHSTVSRALNNSPRVQEATRLKIMELARKHNFQFNASARSLSSRRTGIIGIIYPAGMEDFYSSLYTNRLFMDLRKELENYQLDGILLSALHPVNGESNIERLIRQNKVDGFLIFHGSISSENYVLINKWELPVVQIHLAPDDYPEEKLDFFSTDNRCGGKLAAEHLINIGCRRFFDISIPFCKDTRTTKSINNISSETWQRTAGFTEALNASGIKDSLIIRYALSGTFQTARDFVLENRENFKPGDGLFFHSDLLAFGALTACREAGIRVPEDIRIIGFDDSPIAVLMDVGITTIHQPREIIAAHAAERIFNLLEEKYNGKQKEAGKKGPSAGPENAKVQELVPPLLVKRETT